MRRHLVSLILLILVLTTGSALASDYPQKTDGGILFSYRDEGARNVYWAGDFNGWNSNGNAFEDQGDGLWTIILALGSGEHQYKFVVDGNWIADPSNTQTGGDYDNSMIKVDSEGEVVESGGGPQPSPLNSKLYVDGFYYSRLEAEALESEARRVQIEKPTHSLNLAFDVALNPSLIGRIELNADNIANTSEMWRTALNFQRAKLVLSRPAFTLTLFDNDAVFQSDDALGLVGQVDTYAYDYGFRARGGLFSAPLPFGFNLSAMAADAGIASPWRPADPDRSIDEGDTDLSVNYNRADNEGLRDDWVLQLSRDLGPGRGLYLGHAVRGLTPGNLWFQEDLGLDGHNTYYYRTVQNNFVHALSYRLENDQLNFEVEGVQGQSNIQAKDRSWEWHGHEEFNETEQAEESWLIQETRGLALTAGSSLPWGLSWSGRHSFQENRNILIDGSQELAARALRYGGEIRWQSKLVDWTLELNQAEYHYDDGLGWGDQFVFAAGDVGYGNSWIMGDQLPLDSYTSLGYESISRIKQNLRLLLHEGTPGDMILNLTHTVSSTGLDHEPFYWEVIAELDWRFHDDWSFLFNQRMAHYDQDFLGITSGFDATFLEITYHLNKKSYLALGWGVDPYWLDPVSKQFRPQGRREFLADSGMDAKAIKDSWLGLGAVLDRAETALSHARLLTLEARFDF
jgi:hypothetical protein